MYEQRKKPAEFYRKRAARSAELYDRFLVSFPRGDASALSAYAESLGMSRNEFIVSAVLRDIDRRHGR